MKRCEIEKKRTTSHSGLLASDSIYNRTGNPPLQRLPAIWPPRFILRSNANIPQRQHGFM